jgi:hypothetical protein
VNNTNNFQAGFSEGWRAIKGNDTKLPVIPAEPSIPAGKTPFQIGLRMGAAVATQR